MKCDSFSKPKNVVKWGSAKLSRKPTGPGFDSQPGTLGDSSLSNSGEEKREVLFKYCKCTPKEESYKKLQNHCTLVYYRNYSILLCFCSDTPVAPGFLLHLEIRLKYSLHYTQYTTRFLLLPSKTPWWKLGETNTGNGSTFPPFFVKIFLPWNLFEFLFRRKARMSSELTRSKRWWPSSKGPGRSMSRCYLTLRVTYIFYAGSVSLRNNFIGSRIYRAWMPERARTKATAKTPTTPGTPAIAGRPATVRSSWSKETPGTAGMSATPGMQVTQAAAVTPATSKSKDDSNSITAHNSRNESNNKTANKVGTPATAGMLQKYR